MYIRTPISVWSWIHILSLNTAFLEEKKKELILIWQYNTVDELYLHYLFLESEGETLRGTKSKGDFNSNLQNFRELHANIIFAYP